MTHPGQPETDLCSLLRGRSAGRAPGAPRRSGSAARAAGQRCGGTASLGYRGETRGGAGRGPWPAWNAREAAYSPSWQGKYPQNIPRAGTLDRHLRRSRPGQADHTVSVHDCL